MESKSNKAELKRVGICFAASYYKDLLKPAADKVGESVSVFIRVAVDERLKREGFADEDYGKTPEHLLPIIDDAYHFINGTIESFGSRKDRVKAWEDRLQDKIRYYIRSNLDLDLYEQDQVMRAVSKRYWDNKKDG